MREWGAVKVKADMLDLSEEEEEDEGNDRFRVVGLQYDTIPELLTCN